MIERIMEDLKLISGMDAKTIGFKHIHGLQINYNYILILKELQ